MFSYLYARNSFCSQSGPASLICVDVLSLLRQFFHNQQYHDGTELVSVEVSQWYIVGWDTKGFVESNALLIFVNINFCKFSLYLHF